MSIVPMVKATMAGRQADKPAVLEGLQDLGCLHLIALQTGEAGITSVASGGPTPEARKAWKFLCRAKPRHRQTHNWEEFDAYKVEQRALEILQRTQALRDERDFLVKRIEETTPWGDFQLPDRRHVPDLMLWFYIVPHYLLPKVALTQAIWQTVHKDSRNSYVVVISPDEPHDMPVGRTHTGNRPYHELQRRLEEVENEWEDLQAERVSLSRWCDLFAQSLDRLEDRAAFSHALQMSYDTGEVFALQGWVPEPKTETLRELARRYGLALLLEPPGAADNPPTLMSNPPAVASGQQLVAFYMMPNYRLWDPSRTVLVFFAVFFAIIMSDAGYALVFGGLLGLLWGRLGTGESLRKLRRLWLLLFATSLLWGVLAGSYFGLQPAPGHVLYYLSIVDIQDSETMLRFTIVLGAVHLALANLVSARHTARAAWALAPVGWIAVIIGGVLVWLVMEGALDQPRLQTLAYWFLGAGFLLILFFTKSRANLPQRLLSGIMELTRVTSVFGDVLSYIRLFALGLASASLALAFNDMAGQVSQASPAFGTLLALLVLLIGHGLNLALIIMGGFVHGLRLNYIEFFNWSLPEEGYAYRPFCKKETTAWSS